MPTIDQLAPATSSSDTDEMMASQNGVVVKVTRGQVIAGLQPTLSVPSGTVLGRASSGTGAPETLTIGTNLVLQGGTLSATAGYLVSSLPAGTVPGVGDLVAMGQKGINTAVPFGQFISGLSAVQGVDASQMLITATGATKSQKLADFAAGTVLTSGGTMTGALTLSANPTMPLQAAPKQYVDMQVTATLPVAGGTMTGPLTLAADPAAPLQAATKEYVDAQVATSLPISGGTVTGVLALSSDPVAASQAVTKHYVDSQILTSLPIAGGTMTGNLTLATNPTLPLQAAPKQYVDMQVTGALPVAGGTMTGALTLAADPASPLQAATKEYVDAQVATALPKSGGTMTGVLALAGDPVTSSQAATKHYVDSQVLTSLPVAGGTMSGALTLAANPTAPLQAAPKQYVDAQAAGALPLAGGTMTGALVLAGDPTASLQAATKEYVDAGTAAALPKAGGTMTGALILAGDPAASTQAATKHYVDGQVVTALPLSGGIMTGPLTLSANPATSLQAAPKQYVDAQVGSVFSALPTSPIIGAAGGQFTSVAIPAGGGLTLVGGNLSLAPSGIDFTSGSVTPSDTGTSTTLGAAIGARLSSTGNASASTVIAAGAPTARTLAARFADVCNAKDYGAKGDGTTDDTAAIQRWLAAVAAGGGTGFVPSGNYVISSVLSQTIAGVSVNVRGAGAGNTRFLFTGATNGLTFNLTRAASVWGAVRVSDISIVRSQATPAQANVGLSIIADSTQGVGYNGNSGLSDIVIVGSSPGVNAWATAIFIQDTTSFELRNVNILGPNASGAGTDCGISIVGTSSIMFSVQTDITDCGIQGFSTGISVSGYVQGVFVENSAIIGNWWGINWQGASAAMTYPAASSVSTGSSTIYISPANAAALLAAKGAIVNGTGISPQTRITSTGGVLNINTSTGAVGISPATTGAVTSGESISFQTYYTGEAMNVVNCTFNASYRDIYASWLGFVQIENSSFLRFGLSGSSWAAIDLEECNNCSVSANQILGAFSGSESGIIINSLGPQGGAPNLVTGNVANGIDGYGIVLGGTTQNTTTIANTCYACIACVSASLQNVNPIFGNQSNDNPPDISLNTATGALAFNGSSFTFGSNSSVNVGFTINSAAGGGNLNFAEAGLPNWIIGGSSTNLVVGRYVTPGTLTDIPFILDTATGSLVLQHNLTIGGSIQRQGMASSTPSSGSTIAIASGVSDYRILGSTTLAALTVELPASPANGQTIRVSSQVAITALALRDAAGGTSDVQTPPTTLIAGGGFSAQWNAGASVWWCSSGS
jgi:hypothetical protein